MAEAIKIKTTPNGVVLIFAAIEVRKGVGEGREMSLSPCRRILGTEGS